MRVVVKIMDAKGQYRDVTFSGEPLVELNALPNMLVINLNDRCKIIFGPDDTEGFKRLL